MTARNALSIFLIEVYIFPIEKASLKSEQKYFSNSKSNEEIRADIYFQLKMHRCIISWKYIISGCATVKTLSAQLPLTNSTLNIRLAQVF